MNWFNWFKPKKQEKASRTAILNTKYGSCKWTPHDYELFIRETYKKNLIAYRVMFYIAQSFSSVPWKLYKKQGDKIEIVEEHELNNLLRRPNPNESWAYLMLKSIVYLLASGNSFIERILINETINSFPKELYSLRPDKIKIVLNESTGQISKYIYDETIEYEIDDLTQNANLLQTTLFDPLDDFWGMSPIIPSMREIDTSNEAIEWQKKLLENDARPGMIFAIEGSLGDDQFDYLERELKRKYSGSENAGRNILIEDAGKVDVKPFNWSPAELDFLESNRELARKISLNFGVPPVLLGIPGETTYNNYETARQIFWEDTIIFYLNLYRGELNNWLFGIENQEDLFLDYVLDDIPAFTNKRNKLWEKAQKSDFLTINEKRNMVGLDDKEGGDVILIPFSMVPLGMERNDDTMIEEIEQEDENKLQEMGFSRNEVIKFMGK